MQTPGQAEDLITTAVGECGTVPTHKRSQAAGILDDLGAYVAGGVFVSAGTVGVRGPVPSAPPLNLGQFLGTSKLIPILSLVMSAQFTTSGGSPRTGSFGFDIDGDLSENFNIEGEVGPNDWGTPVDPALGQLCEVRCVVNSGEPPDAGLALNVFHQIDVIRQWSITRIGVGTDAGNWTFTVREIATPDNVVSATFDVQSTATP